MFIATQLNSTELNWPIIIKLVDKYRNKKTYNYENTKTNRNKVQAVQWDKQKYGIAYVQQKYKIKSSISDLSSEHFPDREDLVTRTERDQIVVEPALCSNYERSQN